jgi:predicted secreted protein
LKAKEEEVQASSARLSAENALRYRGEADAAKLKAEPKKIQRDHLEQEKMAKELAEQERMRQEMLLEQKKIKLKLEEEAQEKHRLKDLEEQIALTALVRENAASNGCQ